MCFILKVLLKIDQNKYFFCYFNYILLTFGLYSHSKRTIISLNSIFVEIEYKRYMISQKTLLFACEKAW